MSRFNLSALAVRERGITLFLIIVIAVAGAYAFLRLGRAEDPSFTIKVLTVTTAWPGATAQEMQDLVAEPLEKRMQELRWYDRVETMTRPGLAFMTVTLKDSTPPADVPEEFYQARKKLGDEARNLPSGVLGPFVNDEYSDVTFALYALKAPRMPPRLLVRQAETIRQQLLHVPGVKKVNILGERPERIFVEFSYPRLVTLGITAQDIFAALRNQNAVTPAGSIDTKGPQVFVRLDGAYDDLQKIADTPIVAGGRNLKLSDVAKVRRGYEDPPTFLIRNQGEPALALSVVMQEGRNGLDLGKALETEVKTISSGLPLGITLSKVTDQAVNITEAVDEFMLKFFVALGVVLVVSLLSLGWRVGIVVAAGSPNLGGGFRDHAGHRAGLRPGHTRRLDPGARSAGRRRHHRHRDDGGENGGGHGPHPGSRLRLEPHGRPDAVGNARHRGRADAGRLCPVERRRIRREYLLDRRLRPDRFMGRGGGLHPLSRREAAAADQAGPRGARRDLRDARLSSSAPCDRLVGAPQVPRRVRVRRPRHSTLRAAGAGGRGHAALDRGPGVHARAGQADHE